MSQPPSQLNQPDTTERPSTETATEARHAAHDAGSDIKQQAKKARDRTLERGKQFAEERKSLAAEECGIFGSAIRAAAQSLEEDGQTSVANYAEMCADQLENTADYLRERRLSDMYHDANGFARKHPEIFLGGLFVAGLAAARFLKASEPDPVSADPYATPQEMDPGHDEFE